MKSNFKNLINFLMKNLIYGFNELSILFVHLIKMFSVLIDSIFLSKFQNKKNFYPKKKNLKIIVFKTGNLGDHLIAIDCLNFIQKNFNIKQSWIICKRSSKFKDLVKLGNYHNVDIFDYFDFFKLIPYLKRGNFIIIDTQPKIRLALLTNFFLVDNVYISLKSSFIDNFLTRYFKNIKIQKYDENSLESNSLIKQILLGISTFNKTEIDNKEFKILFNKYKSSFLKINPSKRNIKSLKSHDEIINKLSNYKKTIYLYYGTSGKATHRLAPLNWLEDLLKDIIQDFNIILVGGKSELVLKNSINPKLYTSFELINKFDVFQWSFILSNSKYKLPLLAFDGGFSHLYGVHMPYIFQIFCSSNSKKWRNKSDQAFVYDCLKGGSPNYKPHLFKVPDYCKFSEKAWEETNPELVALSFRKWIKELELY